MSADTLQPDLYDMMDKKRRASSFSPFTYPSCVHAYENVDVDNIPALPTLFTHDHVQSNGYTNIGIDDCSLSRSLPSSSLIPPHHHESTIISTVHDETDSPE